MPRVPALTPKKLIQKLKQLGFKEDHVTGSHVILYHSIGRRAVVPLHHRDLPRGTLMAILREADIDFEVLFGRYWKIKR